MNGHILLIGGILYPTFDLIDLIGGVFCCVSFVIDVRSGSADMLGGVNRVFIVSRIGKDHIPVFLYPFIRTYIVPFMNLMSLFHIA